LDANKKVFAVSAKQGEGIVELKAYLRQTMGLEQTTQGEFLARRRHIDAIERALEHIRTGKAALHEGLAGELMAEDLRHAQSGRICRPFGALPRLPGSLDALEHRLPTGREGVAVPT
ncbi:hypothetical protein EBU58_14655, partial [bacterium]|nr:hypothetical protein [bacterium]